MRKIVTLRELFDMPRNLNNLWFIRTEPDFVPHTFNQVRELYRKGYSDGVKSVSKGLDLHREFSEVKTYYDVCGDVIDIPAAIAGIPECFIEQKFTEHSGKEIDIKIDIGMPYYFNAENFGINIGTLLGLIDDTEQKMGVKFNIVFCLGVDDIYSMETKQKYNGYIQLEIPVDKQCLSDIAIVAHPSFNRRVLYSYLEETTGMNRLNATVYDVIGATSWRTMGRDFNNQESRESVLRNELINLLEGENHG